MQKIAFFFMTLVTLFSSIFGAYGETKDKVVFIGHRGYSFRYLENTADAFNGAAKYGFGGAETDVRVTSDGVLVCSHNSEAVFADGTEMEIAEHTYAELTEKPLKNLKTFSKIYLCTFEEYLDILSANDMICFIEFKGAFTEENILKAFDMVSEKYDLAKCPLQSFDINNLILAKSLYPDLPVMLTCDEHDDLVDQALSLGFSIDMDLHNLTQETVDMFHDAGLEVAAWTANTRANISYCLSLGLDYIESDMYWK
ncbi:MAG: glycerophosphodiester phosphodiesterase [Clostridia bacterium]|nr:glycerophosphodiester phosphodiesterase [Clostridia bacterium]